MTEDADLKEVSQALKAVAQQLASLAERLDQASPEERAAIEAEVARTLQALRGDAPPAEETTATQSAAQSAAQSSLASRLPASQRLQEEVLRELARGGPALPLELAAALLTSPERLQAVLDDMRVMGLVEVRPMKEGHLIRLTPQGRAAAKRLGLV